MWCFGSSLSSMQSTTPFSRSRSQKKKKTKPSRITLLLEPVIGAWTLRRQFVLGCLSKDTKYLTLLNLIGNYAPLSLSIYSVLYKANNYELYNLAMHQVWCMYFPFRRKHYGKSPLVLLTQPTGNTSNIHSILYYRSTFTSVTRRTLRKISTVTESTNK